MNRDIDIPKGNSREEIKARERIIKSFYSKWIAENPSKAVWNNALKAYIKVKFISINETYENAARTYESTVAVFMLTEILAESRIVAQGPKKANDKNQKSFSRIYVMRYETIRLIVGFQPSKGDYVQYSITSSLSNRIKK